MADPATNWIDLLVALAPVGQTAIWAGVAVLAIHKFKSTLRRLADNLSSRIGQGDDLKTPWLSIERIKRSEIALAEMETVVKSAIEDEAAASPERKERFEQLGRAISSGLKQASSLTIDASDEGLSTKGVWRISYNSVGSVSVLLDYIYYELVNVRPFTYGTAWAIKIERTDRTVERKHSSRAAGGAAIETDDRDLVDAGIEPGDVLKVFRVV
jgi:hypothetical protein